MPFNIIKGVMIMNVSGTSNISTLFSSLGGSNNNKSTDLFSSLNSSSSNTNQSIGFDLTNYSALKNGSYYKVMKKYYNSKPEASEEDIAAAEKKIKDTANAAGSVVTSFNKLSSLSFAEDDREESASKIEDFVKSYNSLIKKGTDSLYSNVAQKTEWLKNLTEESGNLLEKAGIKVGFDGELSFDKDKFLKADESTLNEIFKGNSSWASKAEYKAEQIYSLALTGDTSANSYTNSALLNSGAGSSYSTSV